MALSNAKRQIVPRGKIWKKQRAAVIARDGRTCQYCRKGPLEGRDAHADHVRPLKHGGEDELWNYVTACELCNKTKSDRWPADGEPDITIGVQNIRAFYFARKAAYERREQMPTVQSIQTASADKFSAQTDRVRGAAISLETVEKMWLAYRERPSANHLVEKLGIHHKTARRYVSMGDPARGIESFESRHARNMLAVQDANDRQWIEQRVSSVSYVDQMIRVQFRKMYVFNDRNEAVDSNIAADIKDIIELIKLREVLSGGASDRREVVHKFADMSDDELKALVSKGKERRRLLDGAGPVIDVTPKPSDDEGTGGAPATPAAQPTGNPSANPIETHGLTHGLANGNPIETDEGGQDGDI